MANKRIPQQFINEVLARTDITDLIKHRIQLQKKGNSLWARCPFHNEKSASFSVSPQKQLYHCFGCKASGNALGFLMDHDGMQFLEALEALARPLGLSLPKENQQPQDSDYLPMQQLAEQAAKYFTKNLKKSTKAIDYLKNRGLSGEIVKHYGIGYAKSGWDNLQNALTTDPKQRDLLVKAGLLIQKDNGETYDRFRDRIMFPIRNNRGDVIAFGGRILDQGEPKYLNSPESILFHKRSELYGLFEARQANRKLERLIVVEGYMDVVALAQHGITSAVATLGTAATIRHVHSMLRYTHELIFCFDGDNAGFQAAKHALEVVLPVVRDDITIRFMLLPNGEDPDSLVRKIGTEAFNELIRSSLSLSEFFFTLLKRQFDITSMEGKAHLGQHAMTLLSQMPSGIFQSMMIEQLGSLVNMSEERLRGFMVQQSRKPAEQSSDSADEPPLPRVEPAKISSLMEKVLSLIIQAPGLVSHITDLNRISELTVEGSHLLLEVVSICSKDPKMTSAVLLAHWQNRPELTQLSGLAAKEHLMPAELWANEINDSISRLFEQSIELETKRLMVLAAQGKLDAKGKQKLMELLSS